MSWKSRLRDEQKEGPERLSLQVDDLKEHYGKNSRERWRCVVLGRGGAGLADGFARTRKAAVKAALERLHGILARRSVEADRLSREILYRPIPKKPTEGGPK